MTFGKLKKYIEEKFTEIEVELEGLPTPRINDQDCSRDYLWEYGQKEGEKNALIDILSKWPSNG